MVRGHVGVVEVEDKILVIWIVWNSLTGDLPGFVGFPHIFRARRTDERDHDETPSPGRDWPSSIRTTGKIIT